LEAFKSLGLSEEILRVLKELGFEKPTEIQKLAIPRLLSEDRDMIGLAQTGTGKTAAFGLPLLERIDRNNNATQGLILAPTRELGKQIAEQLGIFSKYQDRLNVLPVYGGAAISGQIKALKKPQHVIIATPGRLIDLIKRKAVKLFELKYLILDEADEMLNMGFKDELDEILQYTPDDKLTWLFSATMPNTIKKIVKKYMDDPIDIRIDAKNEVNKNIVHQCIAVKQANKTEALMRFLDLDANMRGVVFCRTKRDTQNLAETLLKKNYKADALHGDLSQVQRDRVMSRFKKKELHVLIATDVAARGIDVDDLSHVFHFTLPDDASYYTHRSGRTARAGKKGTSIAFINGREGGKIKRLEKQLGIDIEKILIPEASAIADVRLKTYCKNLLKVKAKSIKGTEQYDMAVEILETLSKEDLISKLLKLELDKLNLDSDGDLNDKNTGGDRDYDRGGRGRGGRGGRGRGGRSGGRGGRGGRSGGRSSGRSGGRGRSGGGRSSASSGDSDGRPTRGKKGTGKAKSDKGAAGKNKRAGRKKKKG